MPTTDLTFRTSRIDMDRETGLPRYIGKFDSREEALEAAEELSTELEDELAEHPVEVETDYVGDKLIEMEITEEGSFIDRIADLLGGEYFNLPGATLDFTYGEADGDYEVRVADSIDSALEPEEKNTIHDTLEEYLPDGFSWGGARNN